MKSRQRTLLIVLPLLSFLAFATAATAKPDDKPAPDYKHTLSSGLFALPETAHSVDWIVINESTTTQTVRVTVYEVACAPEKTIQFSYPFTLTLEPGFTAHNANSVDGSAFTLGCFYEVVVETDSRQVLPTVTMWTTNGAIVIPGTTILPGTFVEIKK